MIYITVALGFLAVISAALEADNTAFVFSLLLALSIGTLR